MKTSLGTMQTKFSCVLGLQVLASGVIAVASISALALALRRLWLADFTCAVRQS